MVIWLDRMAWTSQIFYNNNYHMIKFLPLLAGFKCNVKACIPSSFKASQLTLIAKKLSIAMCLRRNMTKLVNSEFL